MVHRIKLRGHSIEFHGVPPGTSHSRPKSCPTCEFVYDNSVYRKCCYTCCKIEVCFHCVLNKINTWCPKTNTRAPKVPIKGVDVKGAPKLNHNLKKEIDTKSKSSTENGKLPEFYNEEEKAVLRDPQRKSDMVVSHTLNEETARLRGSLDEHLEEKFELDSGMDTQSNSSNSPLALPPVCNMEHELDSIDAEMHLQMETKPIDQNMESYAFLNETSEENFRENESTSNAVGNNEMEYLDRSDETVYDECNSEILNSVIRGIVVSQHNWLPVILLDNETFPASTLQISRLRNGKIFAKNE